MKNPSPPVIPPPKSSWRPDESPVLTFSPLAWLKLQFFLHAGETEIGGFGVSDPEDLLYIQDFITIRQKVSSVTVEFDNDAVADYFDVMVDRGLMPQHFARTWIHTHPGSSAQPSGTDERTFERVFGRCDWSIMFIIARSGQMYARLQFTAGPQASVLLPVIVDWSAWPRVGVEQAENLGGEIESWTGEYLQNILPEAEPLPLSHSLSGNDADLSGPGFGAGFGDEDLWSEEWAALEALEMQRAAANGRGTEEVVR